MTQEKGTSLDQLKRALEAGLIDQATFDDAVSGIGALSTSSGAVASGQESLAVGAQGVAIGGGSDGDIITGQQLTAAPGAQIIYAESGATVVIGEAPVTMTAVARQSALARYLQHLISQNRYLQRLSEK